MPVITSACPRNCYSTCSFKINIRDGRVALIEPDPANKATGEGVCLKGLSYAERVYHPDRILYPLKKVNGKFERISWEEAIKLVVSYIKKAHAEYGPKSILYYSASGTKGLLNTVGANFWEMTGGYTTTYGDLCWPAGLEATRLALGENKHNAPWDIENARLIIMWGKNAAETNIHQMKFVEKAILNGAKLVVLDPRRTETAVHAHMHLKPKPGTDGALALGLAHQLVKNKQTDEKFIEKYVHGYEPFCKNSENYPPEKVAEITGISQQQILELAAMIGSIKPVTINCGFGMQRYTNSGQSMRAIIALLAITGNIGKPGAGWIYANLQSQIFSALKDPIAFFPPEKEGEKVRISISTAKLGEQILHTNNPPVKMIWVERGNPVTQNPDTNTVLKAFRSVDFRVVVEQFLTDTAREADLILPAKTMFEQSDVINAYWHSYIQFKQKVIEPPGEVKPESEIYYLLAREMGFSDAQVTGKIPQPSDEAIEEYLNKKLEKFSELSLEKLKNGPIDAPGSQTIAFSDFVFHTPSGKIELFSDEAASHWNVNSVPDFKPAVESSQNSAFQYNLMTPNTKNRIHSQFGNLNLIRQLSEKPYFYLHPDDAAELAIKEFDQVRVYNDRGELTANVKFDFGMARKCVMMNNGWWISEGGTVNFLSSSRETDMGHGAAFHDTMVNIKKVS